MLLERVERIALADRQAHMAALLGRVEEFEPVDVQQRLDEWEAWLAHDPADTKEARNERRIRELMGEVA